jgi:hypothetical protein
MMVRRIGELGEAGLTIGSKDFSQSQSGDPKRENDG